MAAVIELTGPIRRLILTTLLVGLAASAQERQVGPLPSLAPLIERVAPAVVNISVTELIDIGGRQFGPGRGPSLDDFLNPGRPRPPQEVSGAGSGIVVDAEHGYILTNHHVVENASDILVTLVDNRSVEATVIGTDSHSDLAVLQIEAQGLTEIPIASTDDLKVGDYVVAIGNPFGFSNTVTAGIVSGLGREFISNNEVYEDFIQTDASINPGNSGGALVNLNGELVGINSAIISETGGNVGIGFAIPSEMITAVMRQLLEFGEVRRSLLGVSIDTVTPSFADDYGLSASSGALVMSVNPDSAAERAGIRINDVIVSVAGTPVAGSNELRNTVAMMPPGERVDIGIMRGDRARTVSAVLDLNDQLVPDRPPERQPPARGSALDGLDLVELNAGNGGPGLRIDDIDRNDRRLLELWQTNILLPGDVITAINQQAVRTVAAAEAIAEENRTVVIETVRDSRARLVRLR